MVTPFIDCADCVDEPDLFERIFVFWAFDGMVVSELLLTEVIAGTPLWELMPAPIPFDAKDVQTFELPFEIKEDEI
jgi:hypothetical protein